MKYIATKIYIAVLILSTVHAVAGVPDSRAVLSFYSIVPINGNEHGFSFSVVSDSSIWYTTTMGVFHYDGILPHKVLDVSLFTKTQIEVFLVQALSDSDVWVLGHDAKTWEKTLYHFNGRRWEHQKFPQYSSDPADDLVLFKMHMLRNGDERFGFAVGQEGLCYRYDGRQWSIAESFTDQTLRAVWVNGTNDIWTGGKNNIIFHYDGAGWKRSPVADTSIQNYIFDISFKGADGWAVGSQGILHFDGHVWRSVTSPVHTPLQSIMMISAADGWCGSSEGDLLRYDGKEWQEAGKISPIILYGRLSATRSGERYTMYSMTSTGLWKSFWGKVPTFTDVSGSSNIHLTGGVPFTADFDNNTTEDLQTSSFLAYPDRLYSNRGDGFFAEMTERLHPISTATAMRVAIGDVDNNGFADIVAMKSSQADEWYRNMGGWNFKTESLQTDPSLKADRNIISLADMDNDGDLDIVYLYTGADTKTPPLTVYYNDGAGHFPYSTGFGKPLETGAAGSFFVADLNGDGWPDIFQYNSNARCQLYLNTVDGSFSDLGKEAGLDGSLFEDTPYITWSSPIDINHDGALDVFMVWRKGKAVFFLNDGKGHFTPGESIAYDPQGTNPMGAFVDVDCDGDEDLFLLDRFYRNDDGKFAEDKTIRIPQRGSATFTDIDNDGDADMFLQALDEGNRLYVYRNDLNPANVARITLAGIRSNSAGIGSKVTLWRQDASGSRAIAGYQEVQSRSPVRFALDPDGKYDLEVHFPGGSTVVRREITPSAIQVSEFSFPASIVWDVVYSFKRTLAYVTLLQELLKLLGLLAVLGAVVFISFKIKATKYFLAPGYLVGILLLYVVGVHATVRHGTAPSTLIPLGGVSGVSIGLLLVARHAIRRRESMFISHYRLIDRLGQGGMGTVYRALDIHSKKEIALKVLNPVLLQDPENRKRLMNEGQLLASFAHPHIVKVFEVSEAKERGYIAMEYLSGGTLKEFLERNNPLSLQTIKQFSVQIAGGLAEIHSHNIIHRDIKTGNIMLDGDGNVRIMDFGLSKSPLVTTMTTLGTVLGTLGYVAPEQVTGLMVDHRVDIFSFGVLLYEICTARLPFMGENEIAIIHSIFNSQPPAPSSLRSGIPPALDACIMRCLSKNPDERFQSMDDVRSALYGAL